MAQVAREVEATAHSDPLPPSDAHVESSYAAALDSVCSFERAIHIRPEANLEQIQLPETSLSPVKSLRNARRSFIR